MNKTEEKVRDLVGSDNDIRIGNFVISRIRLLLGVNEVARELSIQEENEPLSYFTERGYELIGALKIRSLEGLFSVVVSEDRLMYKLLCYYLESSERDVLQTLLSNMYYACSIPDGYYHILLMLSTEFYVSKVGENTKKEEKLKRYKEISDLMLKAMESSLDGYTPQDAEDMSIDESRVSEMADELRERLKKNA